MFGGPYVYLLVTTMNHTKTAEPIDMPFVLTWVAFVRLANTVLKDFKKVHETTTFLLVTLPK